MSKRKFLTLPICAIISGLILASSNAQPPETDPSSSRWRAESEAPNTFELWLNKCQVSAEMTLNHQSDLAVPVRPGAIRAAAVLGVPNQVATHDARSVDSESNSIAQYSLATDVAQHSEPMEFGPPATTESNASILNGSPWWVEKLRQPVFGTNSDAMLEVTLDDLVTSALQNSKRITIARIDGFVEQERVTQQDAAFDWKIFAESMFNRIDQKTGSQLDAGAGVNRLLQTDYSPTAGLRRTNRYGGTVEAKQNLKFLESNSLFLTPNPQGSALMTLRYNQPLLRDGGLLVNEGQVILAQMRADSTVAESEAAIVAILVEVVQAYWEVYRLRSRYVVQKELVEQVQKLLTDISQRSRIDARQSMIGQAESELATQRAALATTRTQLNRAQLRLVRATGDRHLGTFQELIPQSHSPQLEMQIDSQTAYAIALQSRPELRAAFQRIKQSELVTEISVHQLLPQLALVLESRVNGISGNYDVFRSVGDQFSEGAPSYAVGLNYELPVANRAAKSRVRESRLRLSREIANIEDTVDKVRLEVDDALASLKGANEQFRIRQESINKAKLVVETLLQRQKIYPLEFDQVSQLYIREILDAQQRKSAAEIAIIDLHSDYANTTIQLRQATGTFLNQYDSVGLECSTPIQTLP